MVYLMAMLNRRTIPLALALAWLPSACTDNCYEDDPEMCSAEPCDEGIGGDDEAGSDDEGAVCTPYVAPIYHANGYMFCGGVATAAEHLVPVAVSIYDVTDYYFETEKWTGVAMWDDDFGVPAEGWENNLLSAFPGVVTWGEDQEQAAYLSRGCCAQSVLEGSLPDGPLPNAACSGGPHLASTPLAYCVDMLDGTGGGGCVYPCEVDEDCPDDSFEFCDTTHPDPYGYGLGVCRYESMDLVPTPIGDILELLP